MNELSTSKTPLIGSVLLREKPVVQATIGRAEATLCAARAFLFEACEEAWSAVAGGAELTLEQRAKVRLSCAQMTDVAKSVVQITYDIGGGTSVYESSPLQRCFRDAHTAATSRRSVVSCSGWRPAHRFSRGLRARLDGTDRPHQGRRLEADRQGARNRRVKVQRQNDDSELAELPTNGTFLRPCL